MRIGVGLIGSARVSNIEIVYKETDNDDDEDMPKAVGAGKQKEEE